MKLVQIWFEDVTCFVDLNTNEIYSAKMKKLKPQHLKKHLDGYYMIKYNGKKRYKSLTYLLVKANEKFHG